VTRARSETTSPQQKAKRNEATSPFGRKESHKNGERLVYPKIGPSNPVRPRPVAKLVDILRGNPGDRKMGTGGLGPQSQPVATTLFTPLPSGYWCSFRCSTKPLFA